MFLKNIFKKQSRFEKNLYSSSIYDSQETVDLEDIKAMLQGYPSREEEEQLVQSMTIVQIFREFIRLIPPNLDPHKKLKILLTTHVLMGDVKHGRLFVQQFINWQGWITTKHEPQSDILYKFSNIHTMIIQKLALISEQIARSKLKTNITLLFKDIDGSVIQFYKLVNCLIFVLSQYDVFFQVIHKHNRTVIMEVYLLLWNDIIALYLMLERFIRQFLECYQQLDCKQSIQIYELFNEFNRLTPQMKRFSQLSRLFQNCGVQEPKWYTPQKREIEELSIFFQNVKIYMTSRSRRVKQEKSVSQLMARACQSTDRDLKKSHSQILQRTDRKPSESYLSNTTMGYMKKLSQATNPTQALQYTFESEQKDEK